MTCTRSKMPVCSKFDFLGIRNLSILADAVDRVKKVEGKEVDIERIPMDDTKTFEMLARGETIGLFQLNDLDDAIFGRIETDVNS